MNRDQFTVLRHVAEQDGPVKVQDLPVAHPFPVARLLVGAGLLARRPGLHVAITPAGVETLRQLNVGAR